MSTLQGWITQATAGLPPSAAEKFSAEIADHAAEARKKHIDAGLSAEEADRAAIADLGDAKQVARTLRDSHFSRREYTRGWAALLASMIIGLAWVVFNGLAEAAGGRTLFDDLAWIVSCANALCGSLLTIMAMRALLTFLREQFDIEAPTWGRRLAIGGLLAQMPYALWISLLVWGDTTSRGRLPALADLLDHAAFDMTVVLVIMAAAAQVVIGALTIGLAWKHRASTSPREKPLRSAAIRLIGAAGLALAIIGLSILVQMVASPDQRETILVTAIITVTNVAAILVAGLTVLTMGVLAYMSRRGMALAE